MTVRLASLFVGVQGFEYYEARFSIRDGLFGRVFFIGTGFHGLHVLFGGAFLGYNLSRLLLGHFSPSHHLSFEFAVLY